MASSLRVKSVVHNFEETYSSLVAHSSCSRKKKGIVNYAYNPHHRLSQAPLLSVVNANNCYYRTHDSRCNNSSATSCSSGSSSTSEFDVSHLGSLISSKSYKRRMHDKEDDVSGKLDKWVKDSVVEILNNLDEAPFLVHIYSDGEGSASPRKTRLVREKAAAETWPLIKGRWGIGSPTPSGIILVEEMKNLENDQGVSSSPYGENAVGSSAASETCSTTRVWGILIQGRGISCPACYVLKTCRVRSVLGFCTHFCLVRVRCFFEPLHIQLKKLWLV